MAKWPAHWINMWAPLQTFASASPLDGSSIKVTDSPLVWPDVGVVTQSLTVFQTSRHISGKLPPLLRLWKTNVLFPQTFHGPGSGCSKRFCTLQMSLKPLESLLDATLMASRPPQLESLNRQETQGRSSTQTHEGQTSQWKSLKNN